MLAAMGASDETVSSLLSWGASPDKISATALSFDIQSKCETTINLLVPVSQVNLGEALCWLSSEKIELKTGELKQLVKRATQDRDAVIIGLYHAARFGSIQMIAMIAKHTRDHSIIEENKQDIWVEAVMSDSQATISALLDILPNPPLEAITLARERGVPGVVKQLLPDIKVEGKEERETLRKAVLTNTAQLLDQIPRDVEFTYNQNMEKLRPLLEKNTLVPYTTLLKQLHLPKVHVDDKQPIKCPSDCRQKQSCQRIRETLQLVHLVVRKLGESSKVFEGIEVSMIGSTREGSRAFYNDECDIHLSLNYDLQKLCFFDVEDHALKKRGDSKARNPDVAKYFSDTDNTFLPKKLFYDFVLIYKLFATLRISPRYCPRHAPDVVIIHCLDIDIDILYIQQFPNVLQKYSMKSKIIKPSMHVDL